MRVEMWDPERFDQDFENVAMGRIEEAGEEIKKEVKTKLKGVIKGNTYTPVYKKGKYAGQKWTARDPGLLLKSARVVRQKTKSGKAFRRKKNIRVYIGHYLAWYADIVEYHTPFMRPAIASVMGRVKSIIGTG